MVNRDRIRGFTVIELLVTLAVASILAVVATPSFKRLIAQSDMRRASTDLALAMTTARSEASKRAIPVVVEPVSSDWANGWTVYEPVSNEVISQQAGFGGKVTISSVPAVTYLSSGRVRNFDPSTHQYELTSAFISSIQRCVQVDVSGAAYVEDGPC